MMNHVLPDTGYVTPSRAVGGEQDESLGTRAHSALLVLPGVSQSTEVGRHPGRNVGRQHRGVERLGRLVGPHDDHLPTTIPGRRPLGADRQGDRLQAGLWGVATALGYKTIDERGEVSPVIGKCEEWRLVEGGRTVGHKVAEADDTYPKLI